MLLDPALFGRPARWLPDRALRYADRPATAVFTNLVVLSITTNLATLVVSMVLDVNTLSLWFMCLSCSALLFLADMGISYSFSRLLARLRTNAGRNHIGDAGPLVIRFFLRRALLPFLCLSGGLAVYLVAARARSAAHAESDAAILGLWSLVCGYMLLAVGAKYLQMANEGLGKLTNERYIVAGCQALAFVVGVGLVVLTRRLWVLPLAYLAGFALQAFLLYRSLGPRAARSDVALDEAALASIGRDSRNLWLLNVFVVISQNIQVMSLGFFAGPAAIASYFFLQRIGSGASNLIGIVVIIDRARITFHLAKGEHAAALRIIRRNFALVVSVAAICTIAFVTLAFVLGRYQIVHFALPMALVGLFALDLFVSSSLGVLSQYVLASGRNPFIPWTLACCALTVGLQFVLVPRYGGYGAIVAFLMGQALTTYVSGGYYFWRMVRDIRRGVVDPIGRRTEP